jgi:hypothetical protein
MSEIADFVVRHGEVLISLYVLADQLGVPIPAVPARARSTRSSPLP